MKHMFGTNSSYKEFRTLFQHSLFQQFKNSFEQLNESTNPPMKPRLKAIQVVTFSSKEHLR